MKVLHTSDWHLGQKFYDYDRSEDDEEMLRHIKEIAIEEKPDVMVVSGDIYHISAPSTTAQKMFNRAILEISQKCPEMTIVITAGNHDSASRLETTKELWELHNVSLIGTVARTDKSKPLYDSHIIEVKKEGRTVGYVAAAPYCYTHNFPIADEENQEDAQPDNTEGAQPDNADTTQERNIGAEKQRRWFQGLLNEVACRNTNNLPVVLMAHLAVTGSDITGHTINGVGGMDFTPLEEMGQGYDYLALGHIHRPQTLENSGGKARYCGTPKAVSFDEQYAHGVTIAEVEHGQAPVITPIRKNSSRPLITWPKEPKPFQEALEEIKNFTTEAKRGAFLRLNVLMDSPLPTDAMAIATKEAENHNMKFCDFKLNSPEKPETEKEELKAITVSQLREMTPVEVAERYIKQTGREMPEDYPIMINECITKIEEEERA